MSERSPRKRKPEEELDLEAQQPVPVLEQETVTQPAVPPEQHGSLAEKLSEEQIQELLEATAKGKPHLEDFKNILKKASANGGEDIFHDRIEKIGIIAAKSLPGQEYNVFKKYIVDTYELNAPDVIDTTPELDFLRNKSDRPIREKESVPEAQPPDVTQSSDAEKSSTPESISPEENEKFIRTDEVPESVLQNITKKIIDKSLTSKEEIAIYFQKTEEIEKILRAKKEVLSTEKNTAERVKEAVPQNLPHGSPDELENFEKNLRKSVADWQKGRKDAEPSEPLQEAAPSVENPEDSLIEEQQEKLTSMWGEGGTPKENRERFREVIGQAKERFKTSEHGERLKAYLAERSESIQEKAKEYGPKVLEGIGSIVERYNKLNWKTKLAVTGSLMLGVSLSAVALPILSGAFAGALYGQRVLGGIGLAINKRKALDVKIAANPEHWLADKSELAKNSYVAALALVYTAGTAFAVHEGVEYLKSLPAREWLENMIGPSSSEPVPLESVASVESPPLSEVAQPMTPTPESGQIVEPTDPNIGLTALGKEDIALRNLAENSLSKHLSPSSDEMAILNNHVASLTPRERGIFDKYVAEYLDKINGNENADTGAGTAEPSLSEGDALTAEESHSEAAAELEKLKELANQQQSGEAPFGNDPIDGHPMSPMEAQRLAELRTAMHDPRETGAWPPGPPEEKGFFEKLFTGGQETADQLDFNTLSAEPHIYADSGGEHLFAYGGSITEKMDTILKYLTENPGKVVYSADDNGAHRIPWYLAEGKAVPGEPIRTSGFLGFGSSFMEAPNPEEFVKVIK